MASKAVSESEFIEAVNYLSHLIELKPFEKEAAMKQGFNEQDDLLKREKVQQIFRTILNYLRKVYESDREYFHLQQMEKSVYAVMALADEAVKKWDRYTLLFKKTQDRESVQLLKEYRDLKQFFKSKVVRFNKKTLEIGIEEQRNTDNGFLIKDLETIRSDTDYELLLLHKDKGGYFAPSALLRHILLVGQSDELLLHSEYQELIFHLRATKDLQAHMIAQEMLKQSLPSIDDFFKQAKELRTEESMLCMSKALLALMLAANPYNLMRNDADKVCEQYLVDFCVFLRQAISQPKSSPLIDSLYHKLSYLLFTQACCYEKALELIGQLIAMGHSKNELLSTQKIQLDSVILYQDIAIRTALKAYPSGPLMQALALVREQRLGQGLDLCTQKNWPIQIYTILMDQLKISCMKIASMTMQATLTDIELVPEFIGFMQVLVSRDQKYLVINLQNRSSWQERARCTCLEKSQYKQEFSDHLSVITFDKNSDFYHQREGSSKASDFLSKCAQEVLSGQEYGFYFPPTVNNSRLTFFVNKALLLVHELFFDGKKEFSHQDRLDYIEIFHFFLFLHIIDQLRPDVLSFTCKDGVDTSSLFSAEVFAWLHVMNHPEGLPKSKRDFLLYLLYVPAMTLRGRSVDKDRIQRMASAMHIFIEKLNHNGFIIQEAFSQLYQVSFFKKAGVQEG
ncbi:hypothetical protein [Candidatus Rhabdochlamydia porcellionis]|jgi:hypothetical protein|uniref:Uncharacterized protein n=1 Tax=Candidatus Rhabdochlamydia porcellionis TaxID=225148 RepID=A0ABX8YZ70_9BACT|nr:hypothetical protein [Candidatus Rhabdochlamydia porcellionis]QZA58659.1 hypothetical protein RHAB15C_0000537 [Candidatus Rhabdochlamydia porcellionis]